jgi:hypothetical protein
VATHKVNIKVGSQGAKKAAKDLGKVDKAMMAIAKAGLVAGAAYFGARGLGRGLASAIRLAGEQEAAIKQLTTATGTNAKGLIAQAAALQQVTTYGDEAIIRAQALIAAFVDDEEQIKAATAATLDLAAAKGMDLTAAADLVSKTLGSSTNAMSRYGIEVEGAVGSSERLESMTSSIAEAFSGQAAAAAETMTGRMKQAKNAVGDAGEAFGNLLSPAVDDVAGFLKSAAKSAGRFFQKLTETPLETTIREMGDLGIATARYELILAKREAYDFARQNKDLRNRADVEREIAASIETQHGLITAAGDLESASSDRATVLIGMNRLRVGLTEREKITQDAMAQAAREHFDAEVAHHALLEQELNTITEQEFIQQRIVALKAVLAGGDAGDVQKKQNKLTKEWADSLDMVIASARDLDIAITLPELPLIEYPQPNAGDYEKFYEMIDEAATPWHELERDRITDTVLMMNAAGVEEVDIKQWAADENARINAEKKKSDADYLASKLNTVAGLSGALGQLNSATKNSAVASKRLAQGEAIINTWAAANQALASGPPPWNFIAMSAVIAAGLANVATIEQQKFARGGDFVTSGPQSIMVGDNPGGRERVSVTPLSSPNFDGPQGGGINLTFVNPIMTRDFVRGELMEEIERAQRLAG